MFYTFVPKACYVAVMIVRVWAMTMRTIWVKFKTVTSMKKNFSKVMLVAAAAMAFFACQKPEAIAPEEVTVDGLNFSAEKPEFADASKTEWTGETIQWSEGDKIRVAYTAGGVWQNGDGTATSDEENGKKTARIYVSNSVTAGETASFSVPGNFTIPKGVDLEFYGVYPSTAASDASMPYAPSVTVMIPAEQKPLANSFDSKADLMAAKSVSTYILSDENPLPEAIPLMWTRIVAHGHLTIKNLQVEDGEKLQTITLTADKDADMVGEHYLYLDTHDVEKAAGNSASNSLTVKADNLTIAEGGNVTFWTCFLPCTWKSLDVVVETDKATYTRSIDLTGKEKTFKQNARNTLAINMETAERVVRASSALPFERDFSNTEYNQNAITELDGFTIKNSVYNAKGAIRLAKTDAGGSVTTLPLDLSQNFHVKVVASGWDDDELTLTVTAGDQSNNLTLVTSGTVDNGPKECAEYIINFQPVSNSASVTFTTEAKKRCYIQKIQILEGHAELTPVLSATNPGEMSAEGGEGSFTYTLSNPKDGKTVSATKNVDWIEDLAVNQENKTVSYSVAENTAEEAREGTITLSYEGAQSVNVVIAQVGKAPEISDQEEAQETLTFSDRYSANTVLKDVSVQATNFNVSFAGAGTSAQYYTNGTSVRAYAKNTFTVSSDKTIAKVEITFGTDDGSNAITTDVGNYQNGTWIGSAKSVTFTVGGTSGHRRIAAITVYYTDSTSGETPKPEQPTLTPRNLTFSAATATATVGQAFTTPTLSGVTTGVTYSSSNTAVATVDASTGAVTLVDAGTTIITASASATDQYEAGEATYTLTVSPATSGNATITITLDMSKNIFGLSTTKANAATSEISKTYEGYTYKFKATDSFYYYGSKATLIGKADSYITFPAIEGYKLTSVEAHNCVGASAKGSIVICSTSNTTAVSGGTASTIAAGGSKTWTLSGTAVNTAYRFYITNANAVQLTKMVLTYKKN